MLGRGREKKRQGLSAHSPSPRARHPNSRSWTHGGPRRPPWCNGGKTDDSFSNTSSRERRVLRWRPTLTVRVIARDKSSTRWLTTAIFNGTSPRGEQNYAVCSLRSANGESVSEKLYWARKIATEGQYGHFVKAEKSEEQMAHSPV